MSIIINLDVMMAKRKIRSKELAKAIGITEQNLSILKTGKARAIRFTTLEAICQYLNCQPGDILEFSNETDTDEIDSGEKPTETARQFNKETKTAIPND